MEKVNIRWAANYLGVQLGELVLQANVLGCKLIAFLLINRLAAGHCWE